MASYRVSLAFARLGDPALSSFAVNVVEKMTSNPSFPSPVVPLGALVAAQVAFANAIADAINGGRQATAAKNAARVTLLGLLRQEAAYVQSLTNEDLTKLLSSGFDSARTNRIQIPLPKAAIERIDNPQSTQLGVRIAPVPTAHAYEVRISQGPSGNWQAIGVFTYSRPIVIENLTPGTVYNVQARAVGGSMLVRYRQMYVRELDLARRTTQAFIYPVSQLVQVSPMS